MLLATASGSANFANSWNTFWNSLSGTGIGTVTKWVAIVGMVLVVFAVGKYINDRRKGQRGNHIGLILTVVLGLILSNPGTFVGYLLDIVDGIANIFIHAFGG